MTKHGVKLVKVGTIDSILVYIVGQGSAGSIHSEGLHTGTGFEHNRVHINPSTVSLHITGLI